MEALRAATAAPTRTAAAPRYRQRSRPVASLSGAVSALRIHSRVALQHGGCGPLRTSAVRADVLRASPRQLRRCSASVAETADSQEPPKKKMSIEIRPVLEVAMKVVCWFAVALFVAAWFVHPSGPLGLPETGLQLMDLPKDTVGPLTGLTSWFAGACNYAVRVIQQDARPALDHLLLRQLPALLHAIGDMCYNPSGAASSHAASVAFWLVTDTVYNSLLLAVITLANVLLLAPATLFNFVLGIPIALFSLLFGSPETSMRVGGALAMAIGLYFGVRAFRAKYASQGTPLGPPTSQSVMVDETPMTGLEALRRSMTAYDQTVRGLPPLLYQTAAAAPDAAPEFAAAYEKMFAAEAALDDVEDVFKGKGVVAYTTTVSTAAQVLKLGPAGTGPLTGPASAAAARSILTRGLPGNGAAAPAKPRPAPQMTVPDRAAESIYTQQELSRAASAAAAAAAAQKATQTRSSVASTVTTSTTRTSSSSSSAAAAVTAKVAAEITEAVDTLKPVATYVRLPTEGTGTTSSSGEQAGGAKQQGGEGSKEDKTLWPTWVRMGRNKTTRGSGADGPS